MPPLFRPLRRQANLNGPPPLLFLQVHKLVGRGAPAEFVEQLKSIADEHHESLVVDCIRAYHFGGCVGDTCLCAVRCRVGLGGDHSNNRPARRGT